MNIFNNKTVKVTRNKNSSKSPISGSSSGNTNIKTSNEDVSAEDQGKNLIKVERDTKDTDTIDRNFFGGARGGRKNNQAEEEKLKLSNDELQNNDIKMERESEGGIEISSTKFDIKTIVKEASPSKENLVDEERSEMMSKETIKKKDELTDSKNDTINV